MRALGIDVGTTTTKVVLVDVEGARVREVASHTSPTPGRVPELLATVEAACRAVGTPEVGAVGVASMAETGAPVDAHGAALTELLRWDAGLGADDAEAMAPLAADLFARTGVRLSPKTPLSTWAWLRREQPRIRQRMRYWLGAADLVVHALTGEHVTDHTLAGRTGGYRLADPHEPPATSFDPDLLALVGLTPGQLPRVAAPHEIAGRLTPVAADRTGLTTGIPVVIAGHDHQVAAWAAGTRAPGDVADSLGTAEAVLGVLAGRPDPESVRQQGMSLVRTVTGSDEALVAGSASAGAMLRHWLDTVPPDLREGVLAETVHELVADPRPTGAAVAPYLRGRATPEPDPHARAGRPPSGWTDRRQARAVVEGICYQARWMIETQLATATPRLVSVIGGDRLPRLWTELKRATLPWPIRLVRAGEPVAAGAALLALARSGEIAPADAPLLVGHTQPPPDSDPHRNAYRAFVWRMRGALPAPAGQPEPQAAVD